MQLAQQRFSQQLHQQQIQIQIARALSIEDEANRRAQLTRLRQVQAEAAQRDAQMEAEQHKARWQGVALVNAARKREAERVQEWEDQLQLARRRDLLRGDGVKDAGSAAQVAEIEEKIAALKRGGAQSESIAQQEKLLRTIEAEGVHARQLQQNRHQAELDQLAVEEKRLALKQQEHEAQWQRELQRLAQERDADYARWKGEYDILAAQQAHAADLARIGISRIESIGKLSDTGKVATADAANAAVLAQLLKTQVQAGMNPQQIQALAAVAAAENSMAPAEAIRMAHERVLEERAHMESQADKDRRHQLDLINLQNAAHNHALSAQMQLGVGVAQASGHHAQPAAPGQYHNPQAGAPQHHHAPAPAALRCCSNGHPARPGHPNDKFCAECGAPLQP
jgi:hypothetical protein